MEFLRSKKLEKYSESFENNDYDDLDFIESKTEVKSNQRNVFFYKIFKILGYTNKNKMAKYLH